MLSVYYQALPSYIHLTVYLAVFLHFHFRTSHIPLKVSYLFSYIFVHIICYSFTSSPTLFFLAHIFLLPKHFLPSAFLIN